MNDCIIDMPVDQKNNLLEKCTIVIPTYNRSYYISRCLWYHAHFPFGEILVADSSPDEKKEINRTSVEKLKERFRTPIRYLEFEPETDKYGVDLSQKWENALQHVNTSYSMFCTDKEFLIPTTLTKCIEFLDANADKSVCEGIYNYIESHPSGNYTVRNMYPSKTSLLQNDANARLDAALLGKNRSCNLMGLRRADFHKNLYRTLAKYGIDDIRFGEFTLELLTIIQSKSVSLKLPYCYRDICNLCSQRDFHRTESSSLRYPDLDTYITEKIYGEYFERFTNCLVPEIVSNSSLNPVQAQQYVRKKLPRLIRMRGFYGNTKFTQDPLWYLWRKSPSFLKSIGGHVVPKKYLDYAPVQRPEELIIAGVIENSKQYYTQDLPMPI